MRRRSTILAIVLLMTCSSASAFTDTAAEMISICKKGESEMVVCAAFVSGVIHGFVDAKEHIRLTTNLDQVPDLFCKPEEWTTGLGLEIFMIWAENNPEYLKYGPSAVVLWAHRAAYPCDSS